MIWFGDHAIMGATPFLTLLPANRQHYRWRFAVGPIVRHLGIPNPQLLSITSPCAALVPRAESALASLPNADWPEQAGRALQSLKPVGARVADPHFKLVLAGLADPLDWPDIWRPRAAPQRRAVQHHFGNIAHLPQVQEQRLARL